jgi:hypothetical protein
VKKVRRHRKPSPETVAGVYKSIGEERLVAELLSLTYVRERNE